MVTEAEPRDDFNKTTRDLLARRVGFRCSNPACRKATSGPRDDPQKTVDIGVGAHITAAAPGGPRYDATLTAEQRASSENGIWLCQSCAKLIDNDPVRFATNLLRTWKTDAEARALAEVYGAAPIADYGSDWARLMDLARASFAQVRDSIAGVVHINRERDAELLRDALYKAVGVVVLGASGIGKSAVAKREAEQRLAGGRRCLWFNARSFERHDFAELQADLQLAHPLSETLKSAPPSLDDAWLFLDGLDRLYDDGAFALVSSLIGALGLDQKDVHGM